MVVYNPLDLMYDLLVPDLHHRTVRVPNNVGRIVNGINIGMAVWSVLNIFFNIRITVVLPIRVLDMITGVMASSAALSFAYYTGMGTKRIPYGTEPSYTVRRGALSLLVAMGFVNLASVKFYFPKILKMVAMGLMRQ